MTRKWIVTLALIMMVLSACSQTKSDLPQPEPEDASIVIDEVYPITEVGEISFSYPINTIEGEIDPSERGPDFFIDEPVRASDTVITGSGPANVPILLVNVSFVGELIASTVIDESGRFRFELEQPLQATHSIGLQLGDITGTNFLESQFLYNENYYERPFIGIIFFMTTVVE